MKTLLSLFVLSVLCLTTPIFAQDNPNGERTKLRGAVKKVEIYYPAEQTKNGKTIVAPKIDEIINYNRQGQITGSLKYSSQDELPPTKYFYNNRGHIIIYENYGGMAQVNGVWQHSQEFAYKYDKNGRIIEQLEHDRSSNTLFQRFVLTYDDNENVIERKHFYGNILTPDSRDVYVYDAENRQISQTQYGYKNELNKKMLWVYNSKEQLSETSTEGFVIAELPFSKYVYSYDDKGRVKAIENFNKNDNEKGAKRVYFYDDTKLTEEVLQYEPDGSLFKKTINSLDKYGNILEMREILSEETKKQLAQIPPNDGLIPMQLGAALALSGFGEREIYQYEYDSKGNWVKKIEFVPTKLIIVQTNENAERKPFIKQIRVITYYD